MSLGLNFKLSTLIQVTHFYMKNKALKKSNNFTNLKNKK